jgi:hypothetical protein
MGFDREVATGTLAARGEVAADDQTSIDAAKPLGEAQEDAKAVLDKLAAAPSEAQALEDRRQVLLAAVNDAKEGIASHDVAIQRARADRERMVAALDRATKDLELEFPPLRHADIVQQWLASEASKRQARNGAPADIDRRFARPMGYGNRRPSVPPVASHG